MESCSIDGKLYGVPANGYLSGIVYNKRLFEEAGVEKAPETWEELISSAKLLTNPAKQQSGFGLLTGQWVDWWFEFFVWQAGGDLTAKNADGTMTCTFTDPAAIRAAEFYRQMKNEKVIQPDLTMDADTINKNFAAGKIAMTIASIGDVRAHVSKGMKVEDIGFAMFPKGPAGLNPSQFGGAMWVVSALSSKEHQEAAFLYNSFLSSRDQTIKNLQNEEATGKASPALMVRNDINRIEFQPSLAGKEEFINLLAEAQKTLQLEYYGKGSVGKYIDNAVQKILTDDKADIYTELKKAQDLAEKEGAVEFNNAILGIK